MIWLRRSAATLLCLPGALGLACGSDSSSSNKSPSDAGGDVSDASDSGIADAGADVDASIGPLPTQGQCGKTAWSKAFGDSPKGSMSATESARAVVTGPQGEIFVTGHYRGDADFGGGALAAGKSNRSMFVTAFDATGAHVFSRGYGDPAAGVLYVPQATGAAIARTPGGELVVAGSFAGAIDFGGGLLISDESVNLGDAGIPDGGSFCISCSPDILVLRSDAGGNHVWSRRFGSKDGDAATAVVATGGDIFVVGSFRGTLDVGVESLVSAGKADAFVLKLAGDGNPQWLRSFGGSEDDAALSVVSDGAGGVIVGGQFRGKADFQSKPLTATGDSDGFWVQVSATGEVQSPQALGASKRGAVHAVARRASGELILVGSVRGTVKFSQDHVTAATDAYVVEYDNAGNVSWENVFGSQQNDEAEGVALGPDGNVHVVGTFGFGNVDLGGGPLAGNINDSAFSFELEPDGTHVCSRRFPAEPTGEAISEKVTLGAASDAFGVAVDSAGASVLVGALTGRADYGAGTLASSGSADIAVVKFEK